MDYNRIRIHPNGDGVFISIQELVALYNGSLTENSQLGMVSYIAHFVAFTDAQKALEPLTSSELTSHVEWIENS